MMNLFSAAVCGRKCGPTHFVVAVELISCMMHHNGGDLTYSHTRLAYEILETHEIDAPERYIILFWCVCVFHYIIVHIGCGWLNRQTRWWNCYAKCHENLATSGPYETQNESNQQKCTAQWQRSSSIPFACVIIKAYVRQANVSICNHCTRNQTHSTTTETKTAIKLFNYQTFRNEQEKGRDFRVQKDVGGKETRTIFIQNSSVECLILN